MPAATPLAGGSSPPASPSAMLPFSPSSPGAPAAGGFGGSGVVVGSSSRPVNSYPRNDYFIASSLIHSKHTNVVGDKSTWICFKMHLYTTQREIGIIAARRKHLPPYCDTYQDLIFIQYGPKANRNEPLILQTNFLKELENILDTLSPTIVPLPFWYAGRLDMHMIHPTYIDSFVIQARMNALLYDHASYLWFQTRRWLASPPPARREGETQAAAIAASSSATQQRLREGGLVPTVDFLGNDCYELAQSFANAILVRVSHIEERRAWAERMPVVIEPIGGDALLLAQNGDLTPPTAPNVATPGGAAGGLPKESESKTDTDTKDVDDPTKPNKSNPLFAPIKKQPAVDDPLDIVYRMCTEFNAAAAARANERAAALGGRKGVVTSTDGNKDGAAGTAAVTGGAAASSVVRRTYSAEEEWRCRVAQYLVHVVDDGIFPGALNLRRLLNVITGNMFRPPLITFETATVSIT